MTMGDQWSFKPNDDYKSTHRLIQLLADIVAKGGNFLLNVGPQPDGTLPAVAQRRMKEIGDWLKVNGEAIYETRPIAPYKDGPMVFTRKRQNVYAIYLTQKEGDGLPDHVTISSFTVKPGSKVKLLGVSKPLLWNVGTDGRTTIKIPDSARQNPPCQNAFAFRFEPTANRVGSLK
jgi:alpha-L-fucosidase